MSSIDSSTRSHHQSHPKVVRNNSNRSSSTLWQCSCLPQSFVTIVLACRYCIHLHDKYVQRICHTSSIQAVKSLSLRQNWTFGFCGRHLNRILVLSSNHSMESCFQMFTSLVVDICYWKAGIEARIGRCSLRVHENGLRTPLDATFRLNWLSLPSETAIHATLHLIP